MKFRKKPVIIDAVQWTGQAPCFEVVIVPFVEATPGNHRLLTPRGDKLEIQTLEGAMTASPGDWIIRGVAGELYPCKPDIFDATYEPV